jgi:hypothetical protein
LDGYGTLLRSSGCLGNINFFAQSPVAVYFFYEDLIVSAVPVHPDNISVPRIIAGNARIAPVLGRVSLDENR